MKQFDLSLWLQDKSRKVVTRRGNPVRIICTDRKHGEDDLPIVFLEENNGGEFLLTCRNDGRCDNYDTQYDLFFADEKEELSEFEKELQIIISDASHWTSDDGSISTYCQFGDKEIKKISGQILDLARKELEANYYTKVLDDRMVFKSNLHDRNMQGAYELGKQDALKDLPKWKKATENKDFDNHVLLFEDEDRVVLTEGIYKGEYYIELENLKTLPKEE